MSCKIPLIASNLLYQQITFCYDFCDHSINLLNKVTTHTNGINFWIIPGFNAFMASMVSPEPLWLLSNLSRNMFYIPYDYHEILAV